MAVTAHTENLDVRCRLQVLALRICTVGKYVLPHELGIRRKGITGPSKTWEQQLHARAALDGNLVGMICDTRLAHNFACLTFESDVCPAANYLYS